MVREKCKIFDINFFTLLFFKQKLPIKNNTIVSLKYYMIKLFQYYKIHVTILDNKIEIHWLMVKIDATVGFHFMYAASDRNG